MIFFAFAGVVLRNFSFSDGNLDKAMPPVRTSYDVFANTEHIKWIYDSEQAYYYSPARTGGISGVIGTHPTLYYIFIASFTKLTNLSPYQTAYLCVNLLAMIIILQLFLLVKKLFGDEIALVSLAFGAIPSYIWLFPMYVGFQYDYFTFATLPALVFFMILRFDAQLSRYQKLWVYILFGLFFTEQFLGHYVELFFYSPFFLALPVIFIFQKKLTVKEYSVAFFIILLIMTPFMLYFFPLTLKDHLRGGLIKQLESHTGSDTSKHVDYFPWARFDFWLNVLSVVSIVVFAVNYRKNLSAGRLVFLLFLAYLLFVGFSNYTLHISANRTERQLFQGYPFFVLLPAMGIIILAKAILKSFKLEKYAFFVAIAIAIFITFQTFGPTFAVLQNIARSSFVDDAKWQSMEWIRDNTPKESRVFALSGFEHEFSLFSERVNLKGDLNRGYTVDNIRALCEHKYPDNYLGEWAFREYSLFNLSTYTTKRTGINYFEGVVEPFQNPAEGYVFKGPDRGNQSVPLKFFDYVVLQYRGTSFDPCMAFFINESLVRGSSVAWFNNEMAVIKINKSGINLSGVQNVT